MRMNSSERELHRAMTRERNRSILIGACLVAPLIGGLIWAQSWRPLQAADDLKGSVPQWGQGVVLQRYFNEEKDSWRVYVRMSDGHTQRIGSEESVSVGQKVRVLYRRGKSGKAYITRIEPLEPKAKTQKPLNSNFEPF